MASWNFVSGSSATLGPPPSGKKYVVTRVYVNVGSAPQSDHYYPSDKPPAQSLGPGSVYLTLSGAYSTTVGPAGLGTVTYNDSTTTTHGDAAGNSLSVSLSLSLTGTQTLTAGINAGWVGDSTIHFDYTEQDANITVTFQENGTPVKTQTVSGPVGSVRTVPGPQSKYYTTVTFDGNGGTPSKEQEEREWDFAGWRLNDSHVHPGDRITLTSDATYIGEWSPATVNFGHITSYYPDMVFEGWYDGNTKVTSSSTNKTVKAHYYSSPVWIRRSDGWHRFVPSGADSTTGNNARSADTGLLDKKIYSRSSSGWSQMKGPTRT